MPLLGHDQRGADLADGELAALIREARRRALRRRAMIAVVAACAGVTAGLLAAATGGERAGRRAIAARTHGPAVDARAFRGEGRLAFVSLGRLFVLDGATASLRAVRSAAGPAAPQFSPDGRWLAFRVGSGALW